jgi:hypothetical protein
MRLSEHQPSVIRRAAAEVVGPAARALLFGSRTRSDVCGGAMDRMVEPLQPGRDCRAQNNRRDAGIKQLCECSKSTSRSPRRGSRRRVEAMRITERGAEALHRARPVLARTEPVVRHRRKPIAAPPTGRVSK